MALALYRKKRNFDRTKEPRGGVPVKGAEAAPSIGGRAFVVQKHDASRLHYDFRLELDGVLKSWAVPKGPSLRPADKRLAVEVEDHPVEYGSFEGVIPEGEYGGGTVLVWDRGTWSPVSDARRGLREGHLKFTLDGEKLRGAWALVRMKDRKDGGRNSGKNWLLVKDGDAFADPDSDVTAERPESVILGGGLASVRKKTTGVPATLPVQLATRVETVPRGASWIYEVKWDGYRILAFATGGKVRLVSRNGKNWTSKMAALRDDLAALSRRGFVLDGEVCVLDAKGVSRFQLLQRALAEGDDSALVYLVFDALFADGADLRGLPLSARRKIARELVASGATGPAVRFSESIDEDGATLLTAACKLGLEGIVAKRADRKVHAGRNLDWQKVKCARRQEFVIGGFTRAAGSRTDFGALLLGVSDGPTSPRAPKLVYAGKVGTGFSAKTRAAIRSRLRKITRARSPFEGDVPARGVTWVEPRLVAEVTFSEWTRERHLRHPVFVGLREDKAPEDVSTEAAHPRLPKITHADRVIDPESGSTKGDLVLYLAKVAEPFLFHARGRPLSLVRCPDGVDGERFFQKHPTRGMAKVGTREHGDDGVLLVAERIEDALAYAQFNAIEFHVWGSRWGDLERPERLVFDLDPDESLPWRDVARAATTVGEVVDKLGFVPFLTTTGGKGLHVVVPLRPSASWDDTKAFAHELARQLARREPRRFTSTIAKKARMGKIFVDYLRNGRGATAVAPYSPRARPGLTVAMPVPWSGIGHVDPKEFTVATVPALLAKRADPWAAFEESRRPLVHSEGTSRTHAHTRSPHRRHG